MYIGHRIKNCDVFYQPWRPGAKIKYKDQCFKTMTGKKGVGERREGEKERKEGNKRKKERREWKGKKKGRKQCLKFNMVMIIHSFYLLSFFILKCIESNH